MKIHKKAITKKRSIKYLGILIDSTLSWKDHITNLSKNYQDQLEYYTN